MKRTTSVFILIMTTVIMSITATVFIIKILIDAPSGEFVAKFCVYAAIITAWILLALKTTAEERYLTFSVCNIVGAVIFALLYSFL